MNANLTPEDQDRAADQPPPTINSIVIPIPEWRVRIPKGQQGLVIGITKLNWWQRMWMRFIGWGVEPWETK